MSCAFSTLSPQSTLRKLVQLQRRQVTPEHLCVCSGDLAHPARENQDQRHHDGQIPWAPAWTCASPSCKKAVGTIPPGPSAPPTSEFTVTSQEDIWKHITQNGRKGFWRRIREGSRDVLVEGTSVKTGGWRLCQDGSLIQKSTDNKGWRGCGGKGPSYTVGGNVSWCSHCGKQDGGSSKN